MSHQMEIFATILIALITAVIGPIVLEWVKVKLSKKYNIYGIDKFYTKWRNLNNSTSSFLYRKVVDAFCVYYFFEKFSLIKSILLVVNLIFFSIKKKFNQYIFK